MTPRNPAAVAAALRALADGHLVRGVDPGTGRTWHGHIVDGKAVPDAGGSGRLVVYEVWHPETSTFRAVEPGDGHPIRTVRT